MAPSFKRPRLSAGDENVPPANSAAEDALMAALLSGLDESMFEASPSPSKSQLRGVRTPAGSQQRRESGPKSGIGGAMEGGRIRKSPSSSDRGLVGKSPMTAPDRGSVRTSTADRGHTRQSPASAHGRGYAHKSPTRNPGPGDRSVASTSPVHPGNRCMGSPVRSAQALPSTSSTPQHGIRTPGSSRSRSPVKRKTPMSASEDVFGTTEKSHNAFSVGEGSSSASARRRAALQQEVQAVSHAQGPAVHTIDLPSLPQAAPPAPAEPELGTQDDYDLDWDLDALADIDETALFKATETIKYPVRNPTPPAPPPGYQPTPWARCVVESVHEGLFDSIPDETDSKPTSQWGKTIVVKIDGSSRLVHLKERWADIKVRPGDIVNIISPALSGADTIVVTMKDPATYIVHHPDVLVTMTAIANSMPCPRRPLLQNLARLPEPPSKAMLYGNVLHSLLQGSLLEQSFDPESTRKRVASELSKDDQRLQVWGAGLNEASVTEDLGKSAEEAFTAFGRKWVGPDPKTEGNVVTARDEPAGTLAITGLHDVEEDIWSVKWGLKGKVDASVQVVLKRDSGEEEELVAPLEIKTGRSIGGVRHRAQTLLYTLLMQDRYGVPVPSGLLYYSQRDAVVLVDARPNEVRALMMARNELADWMFRPRSRDRQEVKLEGSAVQEVKVEASAIKEVKVETSIQGVKVEEAGPPGDAGFLPDTIERISECKNCYASDLCMLYRKAAGNVPAPEDDELFELYDEKTMHLTPEHAAFFAHWERLLTLEEHDTTRLRAQLWTMTAPARQRSGRCFADMVIAKEESEVSKTTKISRWSYTFIRAGDAAPQSLLSGHIARGDPVSLSLEPDIICLARGFVTELKPDSVTVSVQWQLDVDKLLRRVRKNDGPLPVFRIDKDELSSGMQRMRGNLAHMFIKDGDARRRSLVVDLAKPRFDPTLGPQPSEVIPHLNADQQLAMTKVLTAKDYALILGMPGTGKTTMIAAVIKTIVARGQTVLLSSYTHSAVDTIVTKLLGSEFDILRIGNPDKVHPDVRHLTFDAQPISSSEELEQRLMGPHVVATTALSIEHPLFFRRRFDYCIVDEASQITLPTCVGPLRCADKFVLVGDHFQLPPIVRRAEARDGGLDVSLFRRLSDAHPDAVAPLAAQYRMNSDIMLLSNQLIYENRLRCGSEEVANQALVLPTYKSCKEMWSGNSTCEGECWIQSLLKESAKAIFIDTDALPARESRAGDLVQNETEAALAHTLASALIDCGIEEKDMAVITPYRQQIKLLTKRFHARKETQSVEILTADKAQGRDKDVIMVSLVRSNEDGNVGDLLRDWRRINVSFTRAKRKLIIFGSRSTLTSNALLADFISLMDRKGWVLKLPRGAEERHGSAVPVTGDAVDPPGEERVDVKSDGQDPKRGKVSERLLNNRPFVREVLQEMNV